MNNVLLLLLLIFLLIVGGVFLVLQIYLSRRAKAGYGLILPIAGLCIAMLVTWNYLGVGQWSSGDEVGFENDKISAFISFLDDEDGHVIAFSNLMVKDLSNGGTTEYLLEFDQDGQLIGSPEAMQYKEEIMSLPPTKLTGSSISFDQLMELENKQEAYTFTLYSLALIALYLIPVVYLLVYLRIRLKRKHRSQSVEKMAIKDLS
ncbi:hypothetical protein NE619_04435 [Anaerovorax odorimutans]|uniref:Cytochrome C biogenesis protein n=1 Tax=Anaerovorax odorimutans TaxID=109327 RepID=A0ABT1RL95_9FIRM|nr:hypothetical protein [Anaerovorax odorimutans]MCQ4635964.1 hypothetical protein [Anaerovorax odorimutans]